MSDLNESKRKDGAEKVEMKNKKLFIESPQKWQLNP